MFDDDPTIGPGFGPELDRWLDQAYEGDEHAKSAARADLTAMADHHGADATITHERITRLVWGALRELGVRSGRMLVVGHDPEILAGLPPDERRLPPGQESGFYATIPATASQGGAPHPG